MGGFRLRSELSSVPLTVVSLIPIIFVCRATATAIYGGLILHQALGSVFISDLGIRGIINTGKVIQRGAVTPSRSHSLQAVEPERLRHICLSLPCPNCWQLHCSFQCCVITLEGHRPVLLLEEALESIRSRCFLHCFHCRICDSKEIAQIKQE